MNVRDILQPLVDLIQTGQGSLDTELYRVEKDIVKAMDNSYDDGYEEGHEDGRDDRSEDDYEDGYKVGYEAGLAAEREPLDPSEGR